MNICFKCGRVLETGDIDGFCSLCRHKLSIPLTIHTPVGWQCIRCGIIHAPWVDRCDCNPPIKITYGSGTTTFSP